MGTAANLTKRGKVVVVNDDLTQREVLTSLLLKEGLEVRGFSDGVSALEALSHSPPPDLIVTDLYMPGIDGWRLCRLLRSPEYVALNRIPVLVVSATFAGAEVVRIAADLGANGFLNVPVNAREFAAQVQRLLRGESRPPLARVLLVEDDASLAQLLREAFEAHGYRADTALSGGAAAATFEAEEYDIVVLDHHLPDTQGIRLLGDFQQRRPDTVFLAITGDLRPELALEWMRQGAAAYVHKPFAPEYLIELCAKARRERDLLRVEGRLEARTQELRQSEENYRVLVEHSGEAIMVVQEGRFVFTNSAGARLLEARSDEIAGRPFLDFIHPADRTLVRSRYQERMKGAPVPQSYELRLVSAKGTPRWAELNVAVIAWQGAPATLNLLRDLTEYRRVEREKERLQTQLIQAQKMESVGRLAGGVAHDFNNMLAVILGNAAHALKGLPAEHPLRDNLEEIEKCAHRSADLTRQLLAFARKQTVAPRVLDLNATVEGMLKMLRRLIGENIDLQWAPAAELWPILMDPSQIDQILANLCVNAHDAIQNVGRVTLRTANVAANELRSDPLPELAPADYVRLSVADNGCGMAPEVLSHLFEPFFTTKGPGKGTGLGLATVYGIVRQNNGFVRVDSQPGQGTEFRVYLPRYAGSAVESPAPTPPPASVGGLETVLLVEDEPALLQITKLTLEGLGYHVLTASSPNQAMSVAREHPHPIHLLITDVVMPGMNGGELAKRLKAQHPALKRLFMSGYTANVIAHHNVLEQGIHFLQKPFTVQALADKVREALGSA